MSPTLHPSTDSWPGTSNVVTARWPSRVRTLTVMKEATLILFLMATIIRECPSVFAVESICPGGKNPDSNVIWCDDFDDATPLSQKYFEYDDAGGMFVRT